MITRVVLGNDVELLNISDVQESSYNTGEFIKKTLTVNITGNHLPDLSELEGLLRAENALSNIKIFKKDEIQTVVDGEVEITYSDEYLESEYTQYCNIQSIIKHSDNSMISVILIVDPTDISSEKAKSLELENLALKEQLLSTQEALDFLIMNGGM